MEQYEIEIMAAEFRACQRVLIALGDGNRQHLMLEMMQMPDCRGVRVGEITKRTHLSRPAVSHHLQILKDAGIVKMRGTSGESRPGGRRTNYRIVREAI